MDGLQSFTYLAESLPLWMDKVDTLSQKVAEKHAEFAALARASGNPTPSLRKGKTGSMESLRPRDEADNLPEPPSTLQSPTSKHPSTLPVRVDINPDSKRLFQDYRIQAKRKRLSASVLSATSGPQKFRSRMLYVHYDSAIQEDFEWLVRSIATARSNLRKGKTNASFKARLAGMGMEESPFIGDRTDYSMRNPNLPRLPRSGGKFNVGSHNQEAFDEADKELEAAQSLCELGAHQFLREGLCTDELSGTRERFDTVYRLSTDQKEIFETLEKERRQKEAHEREQAMAQSSASSSDSSGPVDSGIVIDPIMVDDTDCKNNSIKVDTIQVGPLPVGSEDAVGIDTTIEVDDNPDDSNEFHIDLAAFRRTRRR